MWVGGCTFLVKCHVFVLLQAWSLYFGSVKQFFPPCCIHGVEVLVSFVFVTPEACLTFTNKFCRGVSKTVSVAFVGSKAALRTSRSNGVSKSWKCKSHSYLCSVLFHKYFWWVRGPALMVVLLMQISEAVISLSFPPNTFYRVQCTAVSVLKKEDLICNISCIYIWQHYYYFEKIKELMKHLPSSRKVLAQVPF